MTLTAPEAGRRKPETASGNAHVELRDASRWYGNVVAVNAITCTLAPGITGLLGAEWGGQVRPCFIMIAGPAGSISEATKF